MHFSTRVIEGRNAKENVVVSLVVVSLLCVHCVHKSAVRVKNCFWKTRRSRREVDCAVIVVGYVDFRGGSRAVLNHLVVTIGKRGALLSYVEKRSNRGYAFARILPALLQTQRAGN